MTDTKPPFLAADQRRLILRAYGEGYGLRVFVETGTANGDTPAALMDAFDRLYTIEVGTTSYKAAHQRFMGTNVTCLHGDSAEVLPSVVTEIGDTPALFWLDGHFSGSVERAEKDTPIIEELETIFRAVAFGIPHVVLIDDARLFEGMSHFGEHDWPHVDEVYAFATRYGYTFELADDIIRLTPGEAT